MLKYCALFSLCAGLGLAQQFVTGQAARLVVGQTSFTSQNAGASNTLLGAAAGIAFAGDTLFVADSNRIGLTPINNRVLLFEHMSQTMPTPLGEIPAYSGTCPVCGDKPPWCWASRIFWERTPIRRRAACGLPCGIATDGHQSWRWPIRRIIGSCSGDRSPPPTDSPRTCVLGQPDFNTIRSRLSPRLPASAVRRAYGSRTGSCSWPTRRTTAF